MIREKLEEYYSVVFEKELLDEISKVGTYKKVKEHDLLLDIGDTFHHIPLILTGAIKISRETKNGDEIVGNRTKVKIVKNKVAPPFKQIEFDIMYGAGISTEGDILDLAVTEKIVDKAGAWYSYNNEKIGQGRENSKVFLKENPAILNEIKEKVLAKHGLSDKIQEIVDTNTGEIKEEAKAEKPKKRAKRTLQ